MVNIGDFDRFQRALERAESPNASQALAFAAKEVTGPAGTATVTQRLQALSAALTKEGIGGLKSQVDDALTVLLRVQHNAGNAERGIEAMRGLEELDKAVLKQLPVTMSAAKSYFIASAAKSADLVAHADAVNGAYAEIFGPAQGQAR